MQPERINGAAPVVVITGAGSGLGQALSACAAAGGCQLVLLGRRLDALEQTARLLSGKAPTPLCLACDVTDTAQRQAVMAQIEQRFGRIDKLINNAGVVPVGEITTCTDEQVMATLATNLAAPLGMVRDALPLLKRSDKPHVVNIGSMFGEIAFPLFAAYSASKHGLRGLSDALRRELAPMGIAVTWAAPRAIQTPAASGFAHLVEQFEMTLDPANKVAAHLWSGITARKASIYPAGPERIFAFIQRIAPGLIDNNLGKMMQKPTMRH